MSADIQALEVAFAKNPSLESSIPLCEAYLGEKRFMEAMVVCKKGMKGSPGDPRGRAMLGRVYLEQGKIPKATQELQTALGEAPTHPNVLELAGRLAVENGQQAEAVQYFQQALAQDPTLAISQAALQQLGGAAPAAAPAAPVPGAPPVQAAPPAQVAPPVQAAPPGQPVTLQQPTSPPVQGAPPAQPPPMAQPPGAAPPAMPGQPAAAPPPAPGGASPWADNQGPGAPVQPDGEHHLEHVQDFFAPDTLGFASPDASHIETAGPGRLTIVGFVPKSGGSLKVTFGLFVIGLAVAGAWLGYRYYDAQKQIELNKLFGELKVAMNEDLYLRYRDALDIGNDILARLDPDHKKTLAAVAYIEAVLALEHGEVGAMARAKSALQKANQASGDETEYRIAADALIAYAEQRYDQGLSDIKKLMSEGASTNLIELEALRLMLASQPGSTETRKQVARLVELATSSSRVYTFLGWYYYGEERWSSADEYFGKALQTTKGHPVALLGLALADFSRGLGLKERQKEIEKNINKVFGLPKDEISPPVKALAHFARGQLRQWRRKGDAKSDFAQAVKLDPRNPRFNYDRGAALLRQGEYSAAVKELTQARDKAPNNVLFYRRLAEAETKAKKFDAAQATLAQAAKIATDKTDLILLQADLFLAQKKYSEAKAKYGEIKEDDGFEAVAASKVGISAAMRGSGDPSGAAKSIEKYLEAIPSDADAEGQAKLWCELGQSFEATRGGKDKAIKSYETGIEQYRHYPDCHYYLCRAIGRGGAAKQACRAYLQLAPRGPFARDATRRAK